MSMLECSAIVGIVILVGWIGIAGLLIETRYLRESNEDQAKRLAAMSIELCQERITKQRLVHELKQLYARLRYYKEPRDAEVN